MRKNVSNTFCINGCITNTLLKFRKLPFGTILTFLNRDLSEINTLLSLLRPDEISKTKDEFNLLQSACGRCLF